MKGQNYINGNWIDSESVIDSINPNTGELLGVIPNSNLTETQFAVKSARNAFVKWSQTTIDYRIEILKKVVAFLIDEYGEEGQVTPLKQLISNEVGKRLPEADIEVIESSDMIQYFIDNAKNILKEREISLNQDLWSQKESILTFEPRGVIAIIKPWNYPLEVPIWSIAPALVSGNTIVFKPSEHSTFVAIELIKIFEKAGIPKGVINLISGDGSTGHFLVNNDDINMISFTGSQKIGKEINIIAASKFIKCSLELSGNDAAIVDESANLELAANGLVWGAFCNSGQVCVGVKRAYIHKNIIINLTSSIVEKTNKLIKDKDYGPIISKKQLSLIDAFVKDAVTKGAKVLTGGKIIESVEGFYYPPTVLINVSKEMRLIKEECFGNILPIIEFSNMDEAINYANDSNYGLGASVWSTNEENYNLLTSKIKAGMVWVNDVNVAFPEAPWSGIKNSGGGIDLSDFGLLEYVNLKHINTEISSENKRNWWYPY